jgi:(5-formylfuran-3-yl)methyl phosphate synthase
MSGMLASVNSLAEARLVAQFDVDIIDLKQPAQGALGALEASEVKAIVGALAPETVISATVGDLPMQATLLANAVNAMAATGVDYVKIGFFPGGDWQACIEQLAVPANNGHALIAVLFADTRPELSIIDSLHQAGFRGVMLDTMDKQAGSLTRLLNRGELQAFVQKAKSHALLTGLAGSLTIDDIPGLRGLEADYLGFRGALCHQRTRTAELDSKRIADIRQCLSAAVNEF